MPESEELSWPPGSVVVDSPVSGSVWQAASVVGQSVCVGDTLMILESMKMEIPIVAPCDGIVSRLLLAEGVRVRAGQPLVVVETDR